jgi:AmiR/NasT family two-component response regulator
LDAVKLREQQALAREQAALEREQAAQAEVERLKALLAQSNPTSNDQTITLKRK